MHHVYYEEELLALRTELDNHPELALILRAQPVQDIYIHLAEIGAYVGIAFHGTFTKQEILDLCTLFTKKLIDKRTTTIIV